MTTICTSGVFRLSGLVGHTTDTLKSTKRLTLSDNEAMAAQLSTKYTYIPFLQLAQFAKQLL